MSVELITILLFASLLIALALGLPISFCLGGVAVIFGAYLWGTGGLQSIPLSVLSNMKTIILVALPLFIFMGMMLERSGIADELYKMMYYWMGPLRGGLAMGTVFICTIFAAMTGISGAATVTMGLIALPSMLKRGYDKKIALGCIAGGGALGVLIPPSLMMIVYAFMSMESVGRLFIGGIFPGLLLSGLFVSYIAIRCKLQPDSGPALPIESRGSWKEKFSSLRGVALPILLIFMVLGSIFTGFATPTEAAALGALGAILCAAVSRRLTWQNLKGACYRTISLSGLVMWIVVGAMAFTTVYTAIGAPELIKSLILGLETAPILIIIGMQITFFILGCFLDPTGIIMICTPVYVPVVRALGFDTVWFGVLFVVNMEMAYLTPPYGFNLFYLKGVAPEGVTMSDIYRSIWPFVLLQLFGLILVMVFPEIILFLPGLMMKR